ncbi:replication-relaxation family protein [Rhizomonospora bruguierae]|uniref:replication-relaxation family protein n=1 Tax=Rhizomonospora bruguierae TaxID=1581705 RepID=UPI0020C15B08|nr:replication-relaxation family protein [Micromonospora sp. NBRC 107566]
MALIVGTAAHRGEDLPRKDQARKRRWHLTNTSNLPHLLAVNGFFTDLAGHARTHLGASLDRWWPASRFQRPGAFAEPDDPPQVYIYRPRVRTDGHGIWTEHRTSLRFFAEIDTGTEPLPVVVDKIDGYMNLARVTNRIWTVLFWLHSTVRERHLHARLTDADVVYPSPPQPATAPHNGPPAPPTTCGGSTADPEPGYASPTSLIRTTSPGERLPDRRPTAGAGCRVPR